MAYNCLQTVERTPCHLYQQRFKSIADLKASLFCPYLVYIIKFICPLLANLRELKEFASLLPDFFIFCQHKIKTASKKE